MHQYRVSVGRGVASAFVHYLLFAKWNFVFTLRNSGPAKTRPARPVLMPLVGWVMATAKTKKQDDTNGRVRVAMMSTVPMMDQ